MKSPIGEEMLLVKELTLGLWKKARIAAEARTKKLGFCGTAGASLAAAAGASTRIERESELPGFTRRTFSSFFGADLFANRYFPCQNYSAGRGKEPPRAKPGRRY
jgi:hypothetical protein